MSAGRMCENVSVTCIVCVSLYMPSLGSLIKGNGKVRVMGGALGLRGWC